MRCRYWIAALVIFVATGCSPERTGNAGTDSGSGPAAATNKPNVTLTNTYWKLVELNGAAVQPGEGKELHMILRGNDEVGGYAGCNQFTGSVTVSGDGLAFGPMASTRRMCTDVMAQEDAYLQALENTQRYSIAGEDLAIEDASGDVIMRFIAVYMP